MWGKERVIVKNLDENTDSLHKVGFGVVVETLVTIPNGRNPDRFHAGDSLAITG